MAEKIVEDVGERTPSVDEALSKLKQSLSAKEVDTATFSEMDDRDLLRFLRARNLDVNAAKKQLIETMAWRKANKVDDILLGENRHDRNEAVYREFCPHSNHYFDKLGRPVYYELTGKIRVPDVLNKGVSADDMVVRHIRQQELTILRMQESEKKCNRQIEKQIIVLDLEGLSMYPDPTAMGIFKRILAIDRKYYPERLSQFFLINCPWFFTGIWSMISPWLDPVTVKKFRVLSADYQSELKSIIDEDNLPVNFGGKAEWKYGWEGAWDGLSEGKPNEFSIFRCAD